MCGSFWDAWKVEDIDIALEESCMAMPIPHASVAVQGMGQSVDFKERIPSLSFSPAAWKERWGGMSS